jgi:deoxyhypusine monooxygenase
MVDMHSVVRNGRLLPALYRLMPHSTSGDIEAAKAVLLDSTQQLDVRIRALYVIKQLRNAEATKIMLQAVDTTDSVLLQHELLYNVGQFGGPECIHKLQEVALASDQYDEVSRHEAIEAIGAIGLESALPFLETLAHDPVQTAPVRESCEVALGRLKLRHDLGAAAYDALVSTAFGSVDPAPALEERDITTLKTALMDKDASLFDRYRAMFALRDMHSDDSIAVLSAALRDDASSCLFRHEIAFVLGQLEAPASLPALIASLKDETEHGMVRHESAEAIGALADKETWDLLAKYAEDKDQLVKDSCVVALEMHKYWSQWKAPAADAAVTA